jgi:hypothetical protein
VEGTEDTSRTSGERVGRSCLNSVILKCHEPLPKKLFYNPLSRSLMLPHLSTQLSLSLSLLHMQGPLKERSRDPAVPYLQMDKEWKSWGISIFLYHTLSLDCSLFAHDICCFSCHSSFAADLKSEILRNCNRKKATDLRYGRKITN